MIIVKTISAIPHYEANSDQELQKELNELNATRIISVERVSSDYEYRVIYER